MTQPDRFNHDFPSCSMTYSSLCIYHQSADPLEITKLLQIEPDESQKAGDLRRPGKVAKISGWFLRTKDICTSKDVRAHIEFILSKLDSKKIELQKLVDTSYEIQIWVFWVSAAGNGGPYLDHQFMKRLADFPIDLNFDICFDEESL